MTTELKRILVFGATGFQGGSVLTYLMKSGHFKLRGLTRDVNSERSKALQKEGIEMVRGDISSTLDDSVFKDVDGVFLLTNFFDISQRNKEFEYGRVVVDQAIRCGVKALIFSSLVNVEKESNHKYRVPHFTDKARLEDYIRSMEKSFKHISFIVPGFYYENFTTFFRATQDSSGNLTLALPPCRHIDSISVREIGIAVTTMFQNLEKFHGQTIPLSRQTNTEKELVDLISKKLGKTIKLNSISYQEYSKLPCDYSEEIGEMMGWLDEFGLFGKHLDVSKGMKLLGNPKFTSFEEWLTHVKPEDLYTKSS